MDPIIPQQQEPQYQVSIPEHKHFLNKKFIIIFVILILLGVSAYAGIWWKFGGIKPMPCGFGVVGVLGVCPAGFICQGANPPVPDAGGVCVRGKVAVTPKADATTDWKTYTNTQYGFSFKYPSTFDSIVVNTTSGSNSYKRYVSIDIDTPVKIAQMEQPNSGSGGNYPLFRIGAFVPKESIGNLGCGTDPILKNIIIGGISATTCGGEDIAAPEGKMQLQFTQDNVTLFSVQSGFYSGDNKQIVDQILSTFKFTIQGQVACTQEAKQCSDGSYVGRTGPNCEFTACPGDGTLTGHVTIGPNCPVERPDNPCTPAPQAYTSRQVSVYKANGTTLVTTQNFDTQGNYNIALSAGTYVVKSRTGISSVASIVGTITIKSGQTSTLNFSIDTGIR